MTTTHYDPTYAYAYRVGQLEGTLEIVLSYLVLGAPVPADTVERARALLAHPVGTGNYAAPSCPPNTAAPSQPPPC